MAQTLLDEARAKSATKRPGPPCSVSLVIAAHERGDEIAELIRARDVPASVAEGTLAQIGVKLAANTIGRHRRNRCDTCRDAGLVW